MASRVANGGHEHMNLAIITARGGSKRIPRKNIKIFHGKPMISYAITAARESGLFDHIVVSTEDAEIAAIARKYGAETPFIRPAALADDYTATVPVVVHGIQACRDLGWTFEQVCCLYPSVPFIQIEDLKGALSLLLEKRADYCYPVTEFATPVQRAFRRLDNGKMQPLYPQFELMRTQDLEPSYCDAGQFYWGKTEAWLNIPKMHSGGVGYVIPNWRAVDIDTSEDWLRAEILFKCFS